MPRKLTENQKSVLKENEKLLRNTCRTGNLEEAESIMKRIQHAFLNDRNHFRVLRAKLWYFEALLDAGNTETALGGFEAIHVRSNWGTRIYLECSAFLGICFLRLKRIEDAKRHIRFVVESASDIKSNERRRQFQKRLISRIEEECILSQLIGEGQNSLDAKEIQEQSVELVKKSEDEVFETLGNSLPNRTEGLLHDVTEYSIKLMPSHDQKLLTAPPTNLPKVELGKKAYAALKRIGWRTFCDESSSVFKLWSKGIPKVFNEGYFSSSIVASLASWKIGVPQLAAGLIAIAMKYGCEEFCQHFKPEGLMIPQDEKD